VRAVSGRQLTADHCCLQTLTGIAVEKNSTIVFPLPIEFMKL
jgi:hypothetical protein